MALVIDTPGATVTNSGRETGRPAVTITAPDVRFTNAPGGELVDSGGVGDQPVIRIEAPGAIIINQDGAVIRSLNGNAIFGGSTYIENAGLIVGRISLGGGGNVYDGRLGSGTAVSGGEGDDTLLGGAGRDTLSGGAGSDQINGGLGADTLSGRGGDRLFGTVAEFAGDTLSSIDFGDVIDVAGIAFDQSGTRKIGTTLFLNAENSLTLDPVYSSYRVTYTPTATGTGIQLTLDDASLSDFDGDGRSDLLWREADGSLSVWDVDGNRRGDQVSRNSVFAEVDPSWRVVETFDMSGDGRSDILWRRTDGTVSVWFATDRGFAPGSYTSAPVEADWRIAAVGDYDSDARDDILWQRADSSITIWTSSGTSLAAGYRHGPVGESWKVVGWTDFDGFRGDDILWRDTSGAISIWDSAIFPTSRPPTIPTLDENAYYDAGVGNEWSIAGLGDFNGDRLSDILWRRDDGAISIWESASRVNALGFRKNSYFDIVPQDWRVDQVGDFNADGRMDLLWRHEGGAISTWLSTGAGFMKNAFYDGSVGNGWEIQGHDFLFG